MKNVNSDSAPPAGYPFHYSESVTVPQETFAATAQLRVNQRFAPSPTLDQPAYIAAHILPTTPAPIQIFPKVNYDCKRYAARYKPGS